MNVYGSTLASGGGGGTSDYSDLTNKPSIESITLSGNKTAADLGLAKASDIPTVPTKVSQLQNDSGFITSSDIPTIPTKVSQLQNDSGFITSSSLPGVYAGDTAGLVPAAGSDNEGKFLDNNGNWTDPLEDLVQNSGGKVLLDIPSNTYSTYTEAFDAICDILDTCSIEQIASMVIIYGSYYYRISTASVANGLYTIVCHRYNEANAPSADSMRVGQFSKGVGVTFGKWVLGAANNQVTYSLGEYKTAAQSTRIALVDTSVSATMIGKINRSDIYDTTEKVIGKWTDGRPLYQKTVLTTMPIYDGTSGRARSDIALTDVGIPNNPGVIFINEAFVYEIQSSGFVQSHNLNEEVYAGSTKNSLVSYTKCWITKPNGATSDVMISITHTAEGYNSLPVVIVLQYTKTTDAANSYNYADENDYSTSEKIIGKWIDGKTLYQKTIDVGALPASGNKKVAHNISGLSQIVSISGVATNGIAALTLPDVDCNELNNVTRVLCTSDGYVQLINKVDRSSFNGYVTLKYTKS